MKHKNLTLGLLGFLLLIKFVYLPWGIWVESIEFDNERLTLMNDKQRKAISNEVLALKSLELHEDTLEAFSGDLPSLNSEQKINLYWLNLASEIKKKGVKVYNQNVDFISPISNSLGVVTGTLSISGNANKVIESVIQLEMKSPSLFIGEIKLSKPSINSNSELVAQMIVGHWYRFEGESN